MGDVAEQGTTVFPLSSLDQTADDNLFSPLSAADHTVAGCYLALGIISIIANVVALAVGARAPKSLEAVQFLISQLLLANILTGVSSIGRGIWNFTVSWQGGNFMCKVMRWLDVLCIYYTAWILTLIAAEHVISVGKLYKEKRLIRCYILTILTWIYSVFLSVPQAVYFHTEAHPSAPDWVQCVTFGAFTSNEEEKGYSIWYFFASFLFPAINMLVCYLYLFCYHVVKRSGNFLNENQRIVMENKRRYTVMTFIISFALIVLVGPYQIISFLLLVIWDSFLIIERWEHRLKYLALQHVIASIVIPVIFLIFSFVERRRSKSRTVGNTEQENRVLM